MDAVQGNPSKRRKTRSTSYFPPEIRNMLYEHAALPHDAVPEERIFTVVDEDGTTTSLDAARFYIDKVNEGGSGALFAKPLVRVSETTQEVLTLLMPRFLFKFETPHALETFAEIFSAHLSVCEISPDLHIEVDMAEGMLEKDLVELSSWGPCELPHGRKCNMHGQVKKWVESIVLLPEVTHVHLVFSQIWRDFRELRGLSKKFGLCQCQITFQFPTPSISGRKYDFFKRQTMAAVLDIEIMDQKGISDRERAQLVKIGCRGFNEIRQPPSA